MSVTDRLLLQGELQPVPGIQQVELQDRFAAYHPTLLEQVESLDFSWFRLEPHRVRWIDDEGSERWLGPEDLAGVEPGPLSHLDATDLYDVSGRLGSDLLLIVPALGGRWLARKAELATIDRYGVVAVVDEPGRRSLARVPFPQHLDSASKLHAALDALVRAAAGSPSAEQTATRHET